MLLTLIFIIVSILLILIIEYTSLVDKTGSVLVASACVTIICSAFCLVMIGVVHLPYVQESRSKEWNMKRAGLVKRIEMINETDDTSVISDVYRFNYDLDDAKIKTESLWTNWLYAADKCVENIEPIDIDSIGRKPTRIEVKENEE